MCWSEEVRMRQKVNREWGCVVMKGEVRVDNIDTNKRCKRRGQLGMRNMVETVIQVLLNVCFVEVDVE